MSKNEMIMLPRGVVELVMEAVTAAMSGGPYKHRCSDAIYTLRAALEQPQPDLAPYLYYDPNNGETWTHEAIIEGCIQLDGLIALYTKDTK